jgi:S-disulfanyl-L-cysteine oxidoreductase SoxD
MTSTSGLSIGLLLLIPLWPAADAMGQQGENTRSVHSGVYSAAQADRGVRVFESECSLCHAPAEFAGRIFQLTWNGRDVGTLFSQIRTTMPLDRPGSLPPDQYAAVVAYILRLNGYPAGEQALPVDPKALSRMRIEPPEDPGN